MAIVNPKPGAQSKLTRVFLYFRSSYYLYLILMTPNSGIAADNTTYFMACHARLISQFWSRSGRNACRLKNIQFMMLLPSEFP